MSDKNDNQTTGSSTALSVSEPLSRAIGDRYLTYALSTIMHRALPDARDGLKPVHRRILYAMRELKLSSSGGYRKSAKISGDVMGNYHPHGDSAIYDAMARLAQDFNMRYPLVDGQGNFGNIDGDNPAASRYTEARMTAAAEMLMEGLDENAVDFKDNYDGTLSEPEVLPAAFPNILANGAAGIAVGMATNIPPHNLNELLDACLALIETPDIAHEMLVNYIPGPDFPTGGVIVEPRENILDAYKTGRGTFRLRARWEVENIGRGSWHIVVTEIPYQVQKSKLIERLADLIQAKKVMALADVRDESAEDIRIILEPKSKTYEPEVLMGLLFKNSDLEIRFSMNMNVLIDGKTPKVCSLHDILKAYLDHRREVLLRRSHYRIDQIDHRLEVLEGFIVAFLNLDRVIDIIRYDENPKKALQYEDWGKQHRRAVNEADYVSPLPAQTGQTLSDVQVDAILNMRLRALRRLEELALLQERETLMKERAAIQDLLETPKLQWAEVGKQLNAARQLLGSNQSLMPRRTTFATLSAEPELQQDDMIEREPVTIICSEMGWIRSMNGHIDPDRALKFKDGDGPRFLLHAQTVDKLLVLDSQGRFYTLAVHSLPGGRGMGEPLRLHIDLPQDSEIIDIIIYDPKRQLVLASSIGDGFIVSQADVVAQTRAGRQVLNVKDNAKAKVMRAVDGDHLAVVGENRKLLVFPLSELPEMTKGKGVRFQSYKDGGLSDIQTFYLSKGLSWREKSGRTRKETEVLEWFGKRASAGRMAPRGFPRSNKFIQE